MRNGADRFGRLRALALIARAVPDADETKAASVLGDDHELVRVLARRRALTIQILVTALALAFAVAGLVLGTAPPVVLGAAGVVQLGLLVAVPHFRTRTREIAEELIATGHDTSLGVRIVDSHFRRLTSSRERERIARSLEHLLRDAKRWYSILPAYHPPPGVLCLRFTEPEARDVVALLRADGAQARGIALTARLLGDGSSPLYGDKADELREELRRIRYLLVAPGLATGERLAA